MYGDGSGYYSSAFFKFLEKFGTSFSPLIYFGIFVLLISLSIYLIFKTIKVKKETDQIKQVTNVANNNNNIDQIKLPENISAK